MATPIPCDWDGCDQLADILVSDITNGDGNGWCGGHYLEVCRMVSATADEAAATAEAQATDDAAVARLEAMGAAQDPTASDASSDAAEARGGAPGTPSGAGADDEASDPRDGPQDGPGAATGAAEAVTGA